VPLDGLQGQRLAEGLGLEYSCIPMCNGKGVFVNTKTVFGKSVHNVRPHGSEITHAKASKPPRMFRWDAVDTSPDLGGQNVPLKKPSKWLSDTVGGRHERN